MRLHIEGGVSVESLAFVHFCVQECNFWVWYFSRKFYCIVVVVVKKSWRACATPAIRKRFENLCLQSLALTKMSFNDFPLRYDSMGGSWNISFRCVWFWIRCHFPISIFLRLGKAVWYCVTKGNIFFFALLCLFSWDLFLSLKSTSKRCFSKNSFGYPLFFRRVLKLCMFLLNMECDEFVLSRRSASPFMNPFFTPGGWHE